MCKSLVSVGANVNARDANLNTPVMGAASYGKIETADYLIKARADLNAQDRIGATALMKVTPCDPRV